jgi:hypothetical protein
MLRSLLPSARAAARMHGRTAAEPTRVVGAGVGGSSLTLRVAYVCCVSGSATLGPCGGTKLRTSRSRHAVTQLLLADTRFTPKSRIRCAVRVGHAHKLGPSTCGKPNRHPQRVHRYHSNLPHPNAMSSLLLRMLSGVHLAPAAPSNSPCYRGKGEGGPCGALRGGSDRPV